MWAGFDQHWQLSGVCVFDPRFSVNEKKIKKPSYSTDAGADKSEYKNVKKEQNIRNP